MSEEVRKKRRVVPDDKRKRALFSCDRCKQRKIKCKRVTRTGNGKLGIQYDNTTSCLNCSKAGTECATQIPRKKRSYGGTSDGELHVQMLESLVRGLLPTVDPKDIAQLAAEGEARGIRMPRSVKSNEMLESDESNECNEIKSNDMLESIKMKNNEMLENDDKFIKTKYYNMPNRNDAVDDLSTKYVSNFKATEPIGKPFPKLANCNFSGPSQPFKNILNGTSIFKDNPTNKKVPRINDYAGERIVYDTAGKPHYIGYASSFALFSGLCNLVMRNSIKRTGKFTLGRRVQTYASEENPNMRSNRHSTEQEQATSRIGDVPVLAMASDHLPLWTKFPSTGFIGRDEADFYVEVFFSKIHPYYYIFSEDTFREKYQQFWDEFAALSRLHAVLLSSKPAENQHYAHILDIRKVSSAWVFCIYLVFILAARFKLYPEGLLDDMLVEKLFTLIKFSLPMLIMKPSILGIRVFYLLAVHLWSSKNRNSAWIFIGIACRQAISLGLHRDFAVASPKFERQISLRKQTWWAVYILETTMGAAFGRPLIVHEQDITVGYPTSLYYKPGEGDHLEYFNEHIKLSRLLNEIFELRSMIYDDKSELPFSLKVMEKTLNLRKRLVQYRHRLVSKNMSFNMGIETLKHEFHNKKIKSTYEIKRYRLDLALNYHCHMTILCLPFLLYTVSLLVAKPEFLGHLDEPIMDILTSGIESAVELSKILHIYNELDVLEGNLFWDLYFGYTASMVLAIVFIMLTSINNMQKNNINVASVDHLWTQLRINGSQPIDYNLIMQSIYRLRMAMNSKKIRMGESMQRVVEVTEILLHDLGIVSILENMVDKQESHKLFDDSVEKSFNNPINSSSNTISNSLLVSSIYESPETCYAKLTKQTNTTMPSDMSTNNSSSTSNMLRGSDISSSTSTCSPDTLNPNLANEGASVDINNYFSNLPTNINNGLDPSSIGNWNVKNEQLDLNSEVVDTLLQTTVSSFLLPYGLMRPTGTDDLGGDFSINNVNTNPIQCTTVSQQPVSELTAVNDSQNGGFFGLNTTGTSNIGAGFSEDLGFPFDLDETQLRSFLDEWSEQ